MSYSEVDPRNVLREARDNLSSMPRQEALSMVQELSLGPRVVEFLRNREKKDLLIAGAAITLGGIALKKCRTRHEATINELAEDIMPDNHAQPPDKLVSQARTIFNGLRRVTEERFLEHNGARAQYSRYLIGEIGEPARETNSTKSADSLLEAVKSPINDGDWLTLVKEGNCANHSRPQIFDGNKKKPSRSR